MLFTKSSMPEVSFWVSSESSLISLATTEKPFPASPALAASTEAFSASRLVCMEMLSMPEMMLLIWLMMLNSSSILLCISLEASMVCSESSLIVVSSCWPVSIF